VWVGLISHWFCISLVILSLKTHQAYQSQVCLGDWLRHVLVSKFFLTEGQASVSRYVNDDTSKGYSWFMKCKNSRGKYQCEGTHTWGGDFGYPSVSLSPTLSKSKRVKHHIRMKTHKFIALRFWVRGGVNPLCVGWAHVSLMLYLPSDPISKALCVDSGKIYNY